MDTPALSREDLQRIIRQISYKDWNFIVHDKGDGFLVQAIFVGPDSETGKDELQKCRKWYVSSHACLSEVVRTLYMAVEAAEFHEFQERFKFMGQAVFSPHINPHTMAMLLKEGSLPTNTREARTR
jgi:hypothetical protein